MKIHSTNSIFFQKKHVANCQIKNNGKNEECKIFKLDKDKDRNYFKPLFKNKDWRDFCFIDLAHGELGRLEKDSSIYVIESKRGKCLGYCKIDSIDEDIDDLDLIESLPISAHRSNSRQRHYIGETMLAFAILNSHRKNKKQFFISNPIADAMNFYKKNCGFQSVPQGKSLYLNIDESGKFIGINESHTQGKITIIG